MLVNGDLLDEINESFSLNLTNPINATLSDAQGLGTITDDDPLPAVAIDDVTVTEQDTGTVTASFNVTLVPASGRTVSVQYATADGTATAPADYSATGGELIFAAGEATKQVTVLVHSDTVDEIDESFTVGLSNAADATIADGLGPGTITDDDPPSLSISDVTVTESRRQLGQRGFQRHAQLGQRAARQRRLRDSGRERDRRGRLHLGERHGQLPGRADDTDDHRPGDGRPARRGRRELHRHAHATRRMPRSPTASDLERSPTTTRCQRLRSTTSRSPKVTPARRLLSSPSPWEPRAAEPPRSTLRRRTARRPLRPTTRHERHPELCGRRDGEAGHGPRQR